jgi:predicted phosphodiesterase
MKIAVISDIHGNLEAFKEILTDIGNARIEEIVCLGDNVGYFSWEDFSCYYYVRAVRESK